MVNSTESEKNKTLTKCIKIILIYGLVKEKGDYAWCSLQDLNL